jgi:hypothetical protein
VNILVLDVLIPPHIVQPVDGMPNIEILFLDVHVRTVTINMKNSMNVGNVHYPVLNVQQIEIAQNILVQMEFLDYIYIHLLWGLWNAIFLMGRMDMKKGKKFAS